MPVYLLSFSASSFKLDWSLSYTSFPVHRFPFRYYVRLRNVAFTYRCKKRHRVVLDRQKAMYNNAPAEVLAGDVSTITTITTTASNNNNNSDKTFL